MARAVKFDDDVTLAAQPDEPELAQIAAAGFKSVVNNRPAGEEPGQLDPMVEGERARALGMEYRHIPMTGATLTPELVDHFRAELEALPKPVYVHCRSGTRSAALVLMDKAVREGVSGQEAARRAAQLGFDVSGLSGFIDRYAASRR